MEIQELHLKHYGKFEDYRIRLNPGVNVIYGGNETGKTTIHSFVRSMFFGLNRAKGKAARTDEYQIRQPWDRPGAFLGSMRVCEKGEVYRIDRCFDRSTKPLQVTCETGAWEASDPEGVLSALTGGISEAAFVNTVFIPQAHCETDEVLAQELQRFMVNSDRSGDGSVDVTRALQSLRRKKKQFEQKQKKEDELLEARISEKQARAEAVRGELERLRQKADTYMSVPLENETDDDSREDGIDRIQKVLEILLFVAGLLAMGGAALLEPLNVRIFLGVFAAVFFAMIFAVHFLLGKRDPDDDQDLPAREIPPYLLEEIGNQEETYQKLQRELEDLYQNHVRIDGADTEAAALTMAIDRICELSSDIYQKSGGKLGDTASEILSEITGGRYQRIVLDDTSSVRIHTPSRVLGLHQVSGGTMQQIYFALRMAAGELLCGSTVLPVILDETFAMYDDARLEAVLRWLKRSGRQVILFTCQKREREIMKRLG